ncbi:hypothetical protein EV143_101631 [Flavobacterium chryseum]|uniref:Uncharacterized protein n=1 Tax=Flavobacterium circumlabens TaxID=2133765 RepID=A0A4Y7U823_9FLAO|nr:hypothetical protein [Flavobacterium]TCN53833.1 hypothetical protein EV142_108138 [Flavobacterium circumlabens]TDO84185.1 hypothetical protein EV143_101631 [Flavobacterium sp. P3160]TEB42570.1 hypothetical protein D0809_19620 [Flavobacterium circumlabens]
METNSNTDKGHIERETLQLVLEEFTLEQKTNNQHIEALITAVKNVEDKIDVFKKEHRIEKNVSEQLDIKQIEAILQKGFLDIKYMIGRQPKNIVKKFQILLFPEQDAKLFYKIVFSRWFLWLAIMVALSNLYNWGIHYSDNNKEIEIQQIQNDRLRKAWEYMYDNNNKETKKLMKKAYINSLENK